jgi:cell division protein FtsW
MARTEALGVSINPQLRKARTAKNATRQLRRTTRSTDWLFVAAVLLLVLCGAMMAYSTTFYWSYAEFGDVFTIFLKQLRWVGVGLVAMLIASRVDYGWSRRGVLLLMAGSLVALVLVLAAGDKVFGARRTLMEGSVQPSEFVKLCVILYAAAWLDSRRDQVQSFATGLIPFGVIIGIVAGLVYAQPDVSTTSVIVAIACVMFFMAGASAKQILVVMAVGVCAFYLAYRLFDHVNARISEFLGGFGSDDLRSMQHHVRQSVLTISEGGFFGVGPGASNQKFGFLPTPHTDSVFAVLANELGFFGIAATMALFALLLARGLRIAHHADTYFGAFICIGVVTWVAVQTMLNMLSSLALIPFTGVPVPFLSVGGSSLVSLMVACGMLISVSRGSRILHEEAEENYGAERETGAIRGRFAAAAPNTLKGAGLRRRNSRTRIARAQRAAATQQYAGQDAGDATFVGRAVKFDSGFGKHTEQFGRITKSNQRVKPATGPVRWRRNGDGTGAGLSRETKRGGD